MTVATMVDKTVELKDFEQRLAEADRQDDEAFRRLLSQGLELLDMQQKRVYEEFGISKASVSRWVNGKNSPHPAIRPLIYRWLGAYSKGVREAHSAA